MESSSISNLMLSLCRAALQGEKSDRLPQNDQELEQLYACAHHHDMAHIVSLMLYRAGVLDSKSKIGAKLQKAQLLAVYRYEHQRVELERTCRVLEEAGIPHLPLKGSVVRLLYPEPWMRTSTDIDVLVHAEDIPRAEKLLMQKLEYQRQNRAVRHDISLYSPSGVHIELHFDLIEQDRNEKVAAILQDVWSNARVAVGCHYRYVMTGEMFYFYHIAHMAKHFAVGGCGVRSLMDLWLLEQQAEFDVKARDELLARAGLATFASALRKVSVSWFSGEDIDDLGQRVGNYIMRGGTFGDISNHVTIQYMKKKDKRQYVITRIFMPYEQLINTYPSLEGRRYLTFFYQIWRIVRGVFCGKIRGGVQELRFNDRVTDGRTKQMAKLFEDLEL